VAPASFPGLPALAGNLRVHFGDLWDPLFRIFKLFSPFPSVTWSQSAMNIEAIAGFDAEKARIVFHRIATL
jgi:hypothetical protein